MEDPQQMERHLSLSTGSAAPQGELRHALQQMLEGVLRDVDHYLWHTHWKIILKRSNCIIGGLCFKGPPGEAGEVEIGYGIDSIHQNQGYMTEALRAACRWALQQPGVLAVIAETEKPNLPSQRVLGKAGFVPYRETEGATWWRLDN